MRAQVRGGRARISYFGIRSWFRALVNPSRYSGEHPNRRESFIRLSALGFVSPDSHLETAFSWTLIASATSLIVRPLRALSALMLLSANLPPLKYTFLCVTKS